MTMKNVAIVLAIVFAAANAAPYSKFGRSCKDIGCLSSEVCVMAEQSCDYGQQRDQCGRYPTCQRSTSGGESCTTKICPSGQYCRTENGRPTCVNTNAGLASAGVSTINGQQQPAVPADPYGTRYANGNPYANANAPPAQDANHGFNNAPPNSNYPPQSNNNGYPAYPSANNNGYPAYPNSGSNNNNNNGYPAYPGSNNNNGYPPYPNNNRPGGDQYATNRFPQHNPGNPGWNNIYPGSVYNKKSSASSNGASIMLLVVMSVVGCLRIIKA